MSTAEWLRSMTAHRDDLADCGHGAAKVKTMSSVAVSAAPAVIMIRHDPYTMPEPTIVTLELPSRYGEPGNEPT
jgi:hypothetical protein